MVACCLYYSQLNLPLSDITDSNLSDYMQLPLEPQKAVFAIFTFTAEIT